MAFPVCYSNSRRARLLHAGQINARILEVRLCGSARPVDSTCTAVSGWTHGDPCWTVPKVTVRPGVTHRSAAIKFMRRRRKLGSVRIASVVGRLFAIDDAEKRGYVVLGLPEAGGWDDKPGRMLGPGTRWFTIKELRVERVSIEPPQLLHLVDGYWDGWLPDGEVSLV